MPKPLSYWVYRAARGLVKLFYPRPEIVGAERLPEGGCVIVGNHAQMNGPIVAEVFLPGERSVWCAEEMMAFRKVPDYAYRDFWSQKPVAVRWLYRLFSYAIAPLSVCIFNNALCIPVYRDSRVLSTFRETLQRLDEGARVVIFPERDPPHNHILYTFQDRFIDLGRYYARRTGKKLAFVPMYVCPALRKTFLGDPIEYDPSAPPDAERARVCAALADAVTALAEAQPRHRVVPYRNLPKRQYPMSLPEEEPRR